MEDEVRLIVDRVLSGELDPITAADQLRASGQFMLGGVGLDRAMAGPAEALRFQAMMGRLMWLFLMEAGAEMPAEPTSLEEYRDFLATSLADEEGSESST